MTQRERRAYLIRALLLERGEDPEGAVPAEEGEQKRLLRALMNVRPPRIAAREFLEIQDAYLQAETAAKGITDVGDLRPAEEGICLWRGDITTLRCGVIVNAANSQMLGCFVPCHGCIDNAIHTFAGVQLRLACAELMERQGHEEPTGGAKLTPAFNLPCRYVLHTVGPIVTGRLTDRQERQLASCYRSCLALAAEHGIESVAFCCISTGEFRFPPERAAEIAVETVRACRKEFGVQVVFNVFKESDERIYRRLLKLGE